MKATGLALAALLAVGLAACDGGSSGTGITTAQGNVASANTALRGAPRHGRPTMLARLWNAVGGAREAHARAPLEGIRVTIEGTPLIGETDPEGQFGVSGDFAGPIGMVFELPDGGSARLVITVPRGGALTLTNIHVDGRTGLANVDDQRVRFDGLVQTTNCDRDSATVVSRRSPDDGNHYEIHFTAAMVHDSSGAAVACGDLTPGAAVGVDGQVRREGEVDAESVEVDQKSKGQGDQGGSKKKSPGGGGNGGTSSKETADGSGSSRKGDGSGDGGVSS